MPFGAQIYHGVEEEGKVVVACREEDAQEVVETLQKHKYGVNARIIGEVFEGDKVLLKTKVGGRMILEKPIADPAPRVC